MYQIVSDETHTFCNSKPTSVVSYRAGTLESISLLDNTPWLTTPTACAFLDIHTMTYIKLPAAEASDTEPWSHVCRLSPIIESEQQGVTKC